MWKNEIQLFGNEGVFNKLSVYLIHFNCYRSEREKLDKMKVRQKKELRVCEFTKLIKNYLFAT